MNVAPIETAAADRRARAGLFYGLAAYGLWGVMPIYFKWLQAVPAVDIVAHRIVWSLVALTLLVSLTKAWNQVRAALANRRTLAMLLLTAVLIGVNWLLYVYAINSGHILAGSLGYYLNPLANILLGRFILKERLTRLQWAAVGIAAAGIAVLAAGAIGTLWISLTLCFSFATYGLLRKIISVDSLAGLTVETMLLFPLALGWLLMGGAEGRPMFGMNGNETALLLAAGIVSTVPLLCFTAAARRLAYSTVGMLQFIAPTLQFLLAVAVYGERFTTAHAIAFGCIWTALILYIAAMANARRRLPLAQYRDCAQSPPMLNIVSLLIGVVALLCAAIAFIPLLGWANWLIIPLAVVGAGIGAMSGSKTGRNLNLFVIVVGIIRLMIGGGII